VANGFGDDVTIIDLIARKATISIPVGRIPWGAVVASVWQQIWEGGCSPTPILWDGSPTRSGCCKMFPIFVGNSSVDNNY
jgi:YVTN family beta-propeller protein